MARAPADGYTLLVGNVTTNAINENTFADKLSIKPSRDLVGIAKLVEIPHILAAIARFPLNSVAALISEARWYPGKLNRRLNDLVRKETQGWGEFLREARIKIE